MIEDELFIHMPVTLCISHLSQNSSLCKNGEK
jgi:hypothetical protein